MSLGYSQELLHINSLISAPESPLRRLYVFGDPFNNEHTFYIFYIVSPSFILCHSLVLITVKHLDVE